MVNVFGSTGEEGSLGNIQLFRKAIAISGRYGDYLRFKLHTNYGIQLNEYNLKTLQLLYLHIRTFSA